MYRFLHASLQLDALQSCMSARDVNEVLERFPRKIEDIYEETWKRIQAQPPSQALVGKNVLIWVLCAARSLTVAELQHFVASDPETQLFDESRVIDEKTLMELCRGLVSKENHTNIVRFVRGSVPDLSSKLNCADLQSLKIIRPKMLSRA